MGPRALATQQPSGFISLSAKKYASLIITNRPALASEHYVKILREKPYTYAERHFFPHDVRARELSTGASREETLGKLGMRCKVLPATSVDDGISEVRMMLRSCWFDKTKCEKGLEALGQYQKEWDDTRKMYKPTPLHNWTSHGADSFRYGAVGSKSLRSGNRHTTQQFAQSNYDPYNPPRT